MSERPGPQSSGRPTGAPAGPPTDYDLVVIGSGSGNSLVTDDFAGKRVAVVDGGHRFGGTCLNVGCIPTKMFVYAAEVATTIRDARRYGVDATLDGVRWADVRDRIFGRIDPLSEGGLRYRVEEEGTQAYRGHARFVGERELEVVITRPDGPHEVGSVHRLRGEQVVVATGSRAVVPPVVRDSGVPFHTSDTVMRIEELPRHLLVVGGGYIAAEFAHVFSAFGSRVTLVTRGPHLLTPQDATIRERFTALAREQWDVRTEVTVTAARENGTTVEVTTSDGGRVEGDLLLVATGREPASADLGLETVGVRTHDDGRVVVDRHGRTDAPGVWALGDVSAPYQLKHLANHEARVVAHNLAHPQDLRSFVHDAVPSAVFTHPQVAAVGLTEEQARAAGHDVAVFVQSYGDTAYGWAMEDTTGLCKVVADRASGLLLGAHLLGPHASSLIQPLIQAMALGTPVRDVARGQFWIHPALAEVVENALLGLDLAPGPVP